MKPGPAHQHSNSGPAFAPQPHLAGRARRLGEPTAPSSPRPVSGFDPPMTAPQSIRVLCVDDHVVLVEGLKAYFAIDGNIQVVGHLKTADRLIEEVARLRPDVVLLDIEMPGPDAFEMTDRLRSASPDTRVMVFSAHIRNAYISASFRAGVRAYFAKSDELTDIVRGIHAVARGGTSDFLLGPKVAALCKLSSSQPSGVRNLAEPGDSSDRNGPPHTLLQSLTARETEILRLVGKGLTRSQIAAQLLRSVKTIDAHQERIRKKLGLPSRVDLVRFAIREGFAPA